MLVMYLSKSNLCISLFPHPTVLFWFLVKKKKACAIETSATALSFVKKRNHQNPNRKPKTLARQEPLKNFVCVGNKACVLLGLITTPTWENGVFRDIKAVAKTSGWNFLAYNGCGNMLLSSVMVKNMNGQN